MRELLKIIPIKLFVFSLIISTIYSLADYGESFALSYFGTSPLTLDKIIKLTICVVIADIIMVIANKILFRNDNRNEIKTKTSIEKHYFKKLQFISMKKISNIHTGYIHRLISNVSDYFFQVMWQIGYSLVPVVVGGISILIMVCKQSIITGIICILISIIAVVLKYKMLKNQRKYQRKTNRARSRYNASFIDFIQNIIAVRKLNIGKFCNKKIDESSDEYLKISQVNMDKRSVANGIFNGLMYCLYFVVLISTIFMVKRGEDGLPYLLFYMTALGKLTYSLRNLVKLIDAYNEFKVAKKQLDDYFEDSKEVKVINKFTSVKLKNIIFSYENDLTKITIPEFILKKNDKISIMGESGQGKTTAMNILAGLYPLSQGTMLINNKKTKEARLDLVFVSQEVEMFDLTIRDNLCLGKNIPEEKILELLEEAGLLSWYKELPKGLDTMVGERGIKLSAGQKQRLNLIRGILIDKDLYFFDEPTSNLDKVSEDKITNMIQKYLKDKTYVIVTHRPKLKELCNKHYKFEDHMMKEIINV